jgi:hypothetical protein
VCEVGSALEQTHVSSNGGPCTRSNVQGTFDHMHARMYVRDKALRSNKRK